jgi:hypothetical protein
MNFTRRIKSLIPAMAAFSLLAAGAADAKIKTVVVTAEVENTAGDKAATEKRAKREARRMAVEQGAGVLVESNTIVRNYQLVADEIVTKAKGVITREEWGALQVTGNTAKIKLTASVSPDAIEDAICTVIKANHEPKISLVMVEKYGAENTEWKLERGLVEALMTERLMDACFTMVSPGVSVTTVSASGDVPQETMKKIVENTDAQYIFKAQAKVIEADVSKNSVFKDNGMKSYSVAISGQLINVENNEIEASVAEHSQILGISPEHALRYKAGKSRTFAIVDKVLDSMMQKITKRWASELVNAGRVQVVVKGVKNFKAAKGFDKAVRGAFPGAGVERRGLKNKVATYDIEVEGGADAFAEKLEGKRVGKLTIEVLEVTRGKVIVKLN